MSTRNIGRCRRWRRAALTSDLLITGCELAVELIRMSARGRASPNRSRVIAVASSSVGQFFRLGQAAVEYQQVGYAVIPQVTAAQLHHFAGAYQHDGLAVQVAENLARQHYCRVGDRNRMFADAGAGADGLGGGEGVLEQAIENSSQAACIVSLLPGLLQLTQDLGLAEHQGVQSAGHPDQVPGDFFTLVGIEVAVELAGWNGI